MNELNRTERRQTKRRRNRRPLWASLPTSMFGSPRRSLPVLVVALLSCFAALPSISARAATITGQDRYVEVFETGVQSCSPPEATPCQGDPGGPISETYRVEATPGVADFNGDVSRSSGDATLTSSISPLSISGQGTVAAIGVLEVGFFDGATFLIDIDAHVRSQLYVSFVVDEPTNYLLDGTLYTYQSGFFRIELIGPSGPVVTMGCGFPFNCGPITEQFEGVLAPGAYSLEAEIEAFGDQKLPPSPPDEFGSAEFVVSLTLSPAAVPSLGAPGLAILVVTLLLLLTARTRGVVARIEI